MFIDSRRPFRIFTRLHSLRLGEQISVAVCFCIVSCILTLGCTAPKATDQDSQDQLATEPTASGADDALDGMQAAMEAGDWSTAQSFVKAVLIEHSDSPKVLRAAARVAHESGDRDLAASLLLDAVHAEEFEATENVRRAVIGMVAVGKIFDGIELLSEELKRYPDRHGARRLLFDFLNAMELHEQSAEHGKRLVMNRQFDFDLLLELSNTEDRLLENDSNTHLLKQNPSDQRAALADAKVSFDREKIGEAEQTLGRILDLHPDDLPARLLLGRVRVSAGKIHSLADWFQNLSGDYESSWQYWMILGDYARFHGDHVGAARAYWESSRRNPDVLQVWSKLAVTLNRMNGSHINSDAEIDNAKIAAANQRALRLSQLNEQKIRFIRSGKRSAAVCIEIANSLGELGRLWEAEAWAACAMKLKTDPDSQTRLRSTRDVLVSMMRRDMPWQSTDAHPELSFSLARLPLPTFQRPKSSQPNPAMPFAESIRPILRNEARSRDLSFFGRTRDHLDQPNIPIYSELGCGGAAIDYDLDGWMDLYLNDAGGTPPKRDSRPNTLRRNTEGVFQDVTPFAAVGDRGFGQGVCVGDLNSDGFPDLIVLNYGENSAFINNGDGTMKEASELIFPDAAANWSSSAAIADLNRDGLSDVVVVNYCDGLEPVTTRCTNEATGVTKSCAPLHFPACPDAFYEGLPDGGYENATEKWNASPSILGRGLGISIGQLDDEGGLDVYISNDMTNNHYYSTTDPDDPSLVESALVRGLAYDDRSVAQASMGIATADIDQDGDLDLYLTHFENEYNTLYQQQSAGSWQDRTATEHLAAETRPMVGFGTEAVDFDNDGQLELVVTNGHVHFPTEADDSDYKQPMQIFRRQSSGGFVAFSGLAGETYLSSQHVGRALWTLDVDRDGRLDLAVTHQTEPVALLVNQTETENHWIAFQLIGRSQQRDPIGSVIRIKSGIQSWTAALTAGSGYLTSNEPLIRFGLGSTDTPISAEIRWPNGQVQVIEDLVTDAVWQIVEGDPAFKQSK